MDRKLPVKDEENELPIPVVWRDTILALGQCLNVRDFRFETAPENVDRLSADCAETSRYQINSYGCAKVKISDQSWDSSIYIFTGNHWELLVDLIDTNGNSTDLVLPIQVEESETGYVFKPGFIFVP